MSDRYYICDIIGDGQSPETAYRPSLDAVVDPVTGNAAFETRYTIGIDPQDGSLLQDWVLVIARSEKHRLAPPATSFELPEPALKAMRLDAMQNGIRVAMLAHMTGRGIDVSGVNNGTAMLDVLNLMIKKHDPSLTVDDIDFL